MNEFQLSLSKLAAGDLSLVDRFASIRLVRAPIRALLLTTESTTAGAASLSIEFQGIAVLTESERRRSKPPWAAPSARRKSSGSSPDAGRESCASGWPNSSAT